MGKDYEGMGKHIRSSCPSRYGVSTSSERCDRIVFGAKRRAGWTPARTKRAAKAALDRRKAN